jgi:hypothetical protein
MWSDVVQSVPLIDLRNQALAAKKNFGVKDCFTSSIKLELEMYARKSDLDSMGDLDNLLGGVCDGLGAMPTNPTLVPSEWFSTERPEVPPTIPILYTDDKIITSIKGTKIESFGDPYYIIKIYEL